MKLHDTDEGRVAVVYRLSSLGDIVLTTGVLEYWHRTRGLRFVYVTNEEFVPLLDCHPAVAAVVGLRREQLHGLRWFNCIRDLAGRFKDCLLIDLHGSVRSRMLSLFWRHPTVRYAKYDVERRLYLTWRMASVERKLLAVNVPQRYALALEKVPPPRSAVLPCLYLSEREREEAAALLRDRGIGKPLAVLHPYATHAAKTWRRSTWIRFAEALERNGWEWVVVGNDPEPLLTSNDPRRDLTNETDLRMSCAVLSHASVLISGDSGPLHLAGGVGTPVVGLYGPTTAAWGFYPEGPRDIVLESSVPCRPCSLHGEAKSFCGDECLESISTESVLRVVAAFRQHST